VDRWRAHVPAYILGGVQCLKIRGELADEEAQETPHHREEIEFFIDNLLVRILLIIEMI